MMRVGDWKRPALWLCASVVCAAAVTIGAQTPERVRTEALQRRVSARVRALQKEADALAQQSRTLLGQLRQLEIDRELKRDALQQVEADFAAAAAALAETDGRIAALDARRVSQQPGLAARLVEIAKRGRAGYVRLLLGIGDLRELGRATRAVSALALLDRQRVEEHRRTLAALRAERTELERRNRQMTALRLESREAEAAVQRSLASRTALVARIDERRDLTAQLAGELEDAASRLQQAMAALAAGHPADPVTVPLTAFRGDLPWPAEGPLVSRFGRERAGRLAAGLVRNGVEIGVAEATPVRAVHPGVVSYAEPFTGFGNLVIVDHGGETFTLYGYLSAVGVTRGQLVDAGDELGSSGMSPIGSDALYFEVRVDGRPADPVQWLKPR